MKALSHTEASALQMLLRWGENLVLRAAGSMPPKHRADRIAADPKKPSRVFVTLGGYRPATTYPQGGAGERPRGDDRITAGIEPWGDYGRYPLEVEAALAGR